MNNLTENLIAHYKLDDNAANTVVLDSSGNSNNGVSLRNTEDMSVPGRVGNALEFNGTTDKITIPANPSIDAFGKTVLTITAWVNPKSDGEGNAGRVIAKNNGYVIQVWNETTGFVNFDAIVYLDGTNAQSKSNLSIPINTLSHLGVVWNEDGDKYIKLYLNGVLQSLDTKTQGVGSTRNDSSAVLHIGNLLAGNRTFDGLIDDVMIFDKALSENEILNLYSVRSIKMYSYINYQALSNPAVRFVRVADGMIWDEANSILSLTPTYADTEVAVAENAYINGIPVTIPTALPAGDYDMIFYDAAAPANSDAFSSVFRIAWTGKRLSGLPIPMPLKLV